MLTKKSTFDKFVPVELAGVVFLPPMALEAYTAENADKIQTDVLTQARESCYKVFHFPILNKFLYFNI